MDNVWSLKALRERVASLQVENLDDIDALIIAISRAVDIFLYHRNLARDAFKKFDEANDPHGQLFARHLFGAVDDRDAIWNAGIESEANLIGCISITMNMYESLGQLVYRLAAPVLVKEKFYIYHVVRALPESPLKDAMKGAIESTWFEYINAFLNTTKHHRLVAHSASISFIDSNRGGKFASFKYGKDKTYESYWAGEVLEGLLDLHERFVKCGQLLNDYPFPYKPLAKTPGSLYRHL